jgi:Domain of unknown function (DUF4262)
MQALDLRIRVHGWALVQVRDDDDGTAWSYTVGLVENFGRPELTMIDVDLEHQARVLTSLADGIAATGKVPATVMRGERLQLTEVHPDHVASNLFNTWANLYGTHPEPGMVLQVLLPDDAFCDCHTGVGRRLDEPGPLPPNPFPQRRPNRAERRRRNRRGDAA